MPASCLSAAAAKYIPEQVAKCKLPKKQSAAALQQVKPHGHVWEAIPNDIMLWILFVLKHLDHHLAEVQ